VEKRMFLLFAESSAKEQQQAKIFICCCSTDELGYCLGAINPGFNYHFAKLLLTILF
jgi:hypothetical protein